METLNLTFAWTWMALGTIAGAVSGLFFYREDFLGGYSSWRRRMTRLGHIAFFGLGLVNLGYALTVRAFGITDPSPLVTWLLIVSAATMPAVCYLSAFNMKFRHLFPIPVVSLLLGLCLFIFGGLIK